MIGPVHGEFTEGFIRVSWQCSKCNGEAAWKRMFLAGQHVEMPPAMPDGWQKIGDHLICPNHAVVTLVDGKTL